MKTTCKLKLGYCVGWCNIISSVKLLFLQRHIAMENKKGSSNMNITLRQLKDTLLTVPHFDTFLAILAEEENKEDCNENKLRSLLSREHDFSWTAVREKLKTIEGYNISANWKRELIHLLSRDLPVNMIQSSTSSRPFTFLSLYVGLSL